MTTHLLAFDPQIQLYTPLVQGTFQGAVYGLIGLGIVLLYNAGNSAAYGDPRLPERVYTGGQALFDAKNPIRLLARSSEPFIRPTERYEKSGQYAEGTTFVEGLVPFRGQWLLYYGTADSRVGVAVGPKKRK